MKKNTTRFKLESESHILAVAQVGTPKSNADLQLYAPYSLRLFRPTAVFDKFLFSTYGGGCLACTSRGEAIQISLIIAVFIFPPFFSSVNDDVPIYPDIWKSVTIYANATVYMMSISSFSGQVVYVAYSTVNNKRNRLHLESTTAVEWGRKGVR